MSKQVTSPTQWVILGTIIFSLVCSACWQQFALKWFKRSTHWWEISMNWQSKGGGEGAEPNWAPLDSALSMQCIHQAVHIAPSFFLDTTRWQLLCTTLSACQKYSVSYTHIRIPLNWIQPWCFAHLLTFTGCTQGSIRLQGGNTTQGRVEVCNRNEWGTVCDDLWGTPDAQVACRQLGFSTVGAVALLLAAVPDGTGRIWMDNVQCRGTETTLFSCPQNTLGSHNCVHSEDAGVRCPPGIWNS